MKRLLLLTLIFISIGINAQSFNMRTTELSIKQTNGVWTQWTPQVMDVYLSFDEKRLIIYSKETQIFDYVDISFSKHQKYALWEFLATDTKYEVCRVQLYVYNPGEMYIFVSYRNKDFEYKYKILE